MIAIDDFRGSCLCIFPSLGPSDGDAGTLFPCVNSGMEGHREKVALARGLGFLFLIDRLNSLLSLLPAVWVWVGEDELLWATSQLLLIPPPSATPLIPTAPDPRSGCNQHTSFDHPRSADCSPWSQPSLDDGSNKPGFAQSQDPTAHHFTLTSTPTSIRHGQNSR